MATTVRGPPSGCQTATLSGLRALALSVVLSIVAVGPRAAAHARPATFNVVRVDPLDPDHLVAQATWGFAISRDGGATWRWSCAAVLGADPRFEDPDVVIGYEGRILASTFDGVQVSDADGCAWDFVPGELSDRWVVDLVPDPSDPARIYAVTTDVAERDQLYVSADAGRTFTAHGPPEDELLLDALVIAPSRPERLYLSADIPGLPEDRQTLVLRSDDGGATFERLPFDGLGPDERFLRVRAVDPADPDVVFSVVVAATDAGLIDPHRLVRSEDGGATFTTVLEAPMLGDVAFGEDGATVFTGSRAGGVFRSDDGGRTFARVHPDLPVACLERVDGELRACTLQAMAGFAYARSADGGASWEPLISLSAIDTMIECPTCSDVGVACPPWLPDVAFDLGFDPGFPLELEPDGGVGLPRDAAVPFECGGPPPPSEGCACRASRHGRGSVPTWISLALLLACSRRARRRRSSGTSARVTVRPRRREHAAAVRLFVRDPAALAQDARRFGPRHPRALTAAELVDRMDELRRELPGAALDVLDRQ